jgi:methylenetetrahydrofolate reductase (NADPH)
MKIIDHIDQAKEPLFSFEIVPPTRGRSVQDIIDIVDLIAPYRPSWIDVTSHKSSIEYREKEDGSFQKKVLRKRPGTLGICGIIQNRFKIDTVAHILCSGFSKQETEDALIELNFLGVHNVLALRGDSKQIGKEFRKDESSNSATHELIEQIFQLKKGHYLDDMEDSHPADFCVGVAGYPEKHFEAPSLKSDIEYLKRKVDAGAEYIVTQMFFDNQKYFEFVEKCNEAGIHVPIIPGLKVLRSTAQLKNIPKNFYIDLPETLVEEVQKNPQHVAEVGQRWAEKQIAELIDKKVPAVHLYILSDAQPVANIVRKFRS